ncbi:MAG: aminopeptidase P family protein [Acidobacteria bacterium]|nr:aminopeptidase P family protein [Acidobacteriota bacterium]
MRFLLLALTLATLPAVEIPAPLYQARRAQLQKALSDGVAVLYGHSEEPSDLRSGFFQEPNFYYLTGWSEPGAVLLIDPAREILFLPKKNPEAERWTGVKASPQDAGIQALTGFERVMPVEHLERELRKSLDEYGRIHALPGTPQAAKLQAVAPLAEMKDPRMAIARLRMKKSPEEIALIERATGVSLEGHRAAWKRAAPGLYEYQIAASMTQVFQENGCQRHAYAPIVGAGPNALTLHYSRNTRRMDQGELLLMDVAAECSGYASDISRTIPVGAKFSPRQREIYEIVLGAQKAVIDAVKPGVRIGGRTMPGGLQKVAFDYINTHGQDRQGNPLGKYFTHGIGHHVGLEVHDAFDPMMELQAGMVITVEPGIYIPEENIGVRIEDVVLVTGNGARILSAGLPREVEEIEKALAR